MIRSILFGFLDPPPLLFEIGANEGEYRRVEEAHFQRIG